MAIVAHCIPACGNATVPLPLPPPAFVPTAAGAPPARK